MPFETFPVDLSIQISSLHAKYFEYGPSEHALDAVRARVCAVRSGMSYAASYLGTCAERGP